jgi:hypothetical protein
VRIELKDQDFGDSVVSWHRSVDSPWRVPLFMGPHMSLSASYQTVEREASLNRVGWAYKIRRWRGKTVYWTWRRGSWSADARRFPTGSRRLTLVGFARVYQPGVKVDYALRPTWPPAPRGGDG